LDCSCCCCCCNVLFFILLPWKSGTQTCLFFSQLMNDQTCESNVFLQLSFFVFSFFRLHNLKAFFLLNNDSWQTKILQVVVLIS
jgi:hypothetical protein